MIFGGLDLAAKEKNPSGVAIMEGHRIFTSTLYADSQILNFFLEKKVNIVAIDAPLTLNEERYADKYLKRYGAMSLKIPSIKELAIRGLRMREKLEKAGISVIEVFPTATAKILGFYQKKKMRMLPYFVDFEMENVKNEHEVDAIIAAYTAYLQAKGLTVEIDGVIIPRETI